MRTGTVEARGWHRRVCAAAAAAVFLGGIVCLLRPVAKLYASNPPVRLVPVKLAFANQMVGTTSTGAAVMLTNMQSIALHVTSIVMSGPFSETDACVGTIAPGASCKIVVTFHPVTLGTATGTLSVYDDASTSPQVENLSGTGVDISLTPAILTFPNQALNAPPSSRTATLTNADTNSLSIAGISATGDFSVDQANTTCGSSLSSGASCSISVTFKPTAGGARAGTLTVSDSGVGSPRSAKLSGTGLTVALAPGSMNFGSTANPQEIGTRSAAQMATLTNYDSKALPIQSIVVTGDFTQSNTCGSSVPGGQSCSISINFIPTAAGLRSGNLQVVEGGFPNPLNIKLSGQGTQPSLQSLAVTPASRTIATGQTQGFNALGSFSDGSTQNLTSSVVWISSASSVAAMTNNVATAVGSGTTTISATSGAITGVTTLTVSTVAVGPRVAVITPAQTQQFQATVQNAGDQSVSWSVDGIPGGNSNSGMISSTGLYTPPASAGTHQIMAVSQSDSTQSGTAQVAVTDYPGTFTYQNDNLRTGQNLNETVLSPGNVSKEQFGKLFSYPVDGFIYGQPLYVQNVNIPGQGYHNVVYVATESDSVYGFDADGFVQAPLWKVNFTDAANGITTVPSQGGDVACNIGPQSGITGTPVIDPSTGTLYVAARTQEPGLTNNSHTFRYRLHALDLATGAEKLGGSVELQASVPGTGTGNDGNGSLPFRVQYEHNRPGLLLSNGVIYIAFGALDSEGPDFYYHHGWVLAYDANSLAQVGAYSTTPNSWGGSIWQSGAALAGDTAGNVYFLTGNGWFDVDSGGGDYGNSFVKLVLSNNGLGVADYFTPYNARTTLLPDVDLGSGGVLLVPDQPGPHPHLAVVDGKEGTLYVVDRENMGQFNNIDDSGAIQALPNATGPVGGKAVYFQGRVYIVDAVRMYIYTLANGTLSLPPRVRDLRFGYQGSIPSTSANLDTNGTLWMLQPAGKGCTQANGPRAILHAYDPVSGLELYSSAQSGSRDTAGPAVKFTIPTIANGKVYVGTQTEVDVYGLLP